MSLCTGAVEAVALRSCGLLRDLRSSGSGIIGNPEIPNDF
jgi:hypothetical protein